MRPDPDFDETEARRLAAAELLEQVCAKMIDRTKVERSGDALSDRFLDAALDIGDRSEDFARLLVRLSSLGVKMQPWQRAIKARKMRRSMKRIDATIGPHDPLARPVIIVTPEERQVNDEAVRALARDLDIYQRGHRLVRVAETQVLVAGEPNPATRRSIQQLEEATIRERLSSVALWKTWSASPDGERELAQIHPPEWAVRAVAARGQWSGIRHLTALAECPLMRPDRTVLNAPGWDEATGILLVPSCDFPEVPEDPTPAERDAARELLLDVVRDFPFDDGPRGVHAAAWIAGVLTAVGRFAFTGPAPLFLVDANTQNAGKSLLAEAAALLVTGRPPALMIYSDDEKELAKKITCIALDGDQIALIDNIDRPLGDATIDAALTATEWGERVLGGSTRAKLPLTAVWWGTGVNVQFKATIARRTLRIFLDCKLERPGERRLRDLRAYVLAERPRLLAAALTLLRAWEATGRDLAELDGREPRSVGGFEPWGRLVQGAVMLAGLPDPAECLASSDAEVHDADTVGLGTLIAGWEEAVRVLGGGAGGVSIQTVLTKLQDNDEARRGSRGDHLPPLVFAVLREALTELCPVKPGHLPNVRQVGYVFRRLKKRIIGGKRLRAAKEERGGAVLWQVELCTSAQAPSGPPAAPEDDDFDPPDFDPPDLDAY